MLKKAVLVVFYFILSFSVFLQFELKIGIWYYVIIPLFLALISQIILNKRYLFVSLIVLVCFFLNNVIIFGNFFIDTLFQPKIPALDCTGALPMNGNWIRGFAFGFFTSIIILRIYLVKMKDDLLFIEKVLSIILLLLLIASIIFPEAFYNLHISILEVSKPIVILPEEC